MKSPICLFAILAISIGCTPEKRVNVNERFAVTTFYIDMSIGSVYVLKDKESGREFLLSYKGGIAEIRPKFDLTNFSTLVSP